ncbi:MAG: biopolymer transporter ExbD [Akkermansiaceae bacterium]|jgi:biopolymer transport protein ExbD|nr:biopolymer transporter ExbD [Akkermansiaceae bacterium]
MARHKHYEAVEEDQAGLNISSLIDVTFLLMIYFLVTCVVRVEEKDLALELPRPGPTSPTPVLPLLIRVEATGQISMGAHGHGHQLADSDPDSRELPLLRRFVALWSAANHAPDDQPLVQVCADEEARQQRVIDVLNVLADHKIEAVTFTDLAN